MLVIKKGESAANVGAQAAPQRWDGAGDGGADKTEPLRAVLEFTLSSMNFCADLMDVHKILPFMKYMPSPAGPTYLVGFINFHGESVPLIDMAERLGMERATPYGLDTPVLIVKDSERLSALVVDDVAAISESGDGAVRLGQAVGIKPFKNVVFTTSGSMSLLVDMGALTRFEGDDEYLKVNLVELNEFIKSAKTRL